MWYSLKFRSSRIFRFLIKMYGITWSFSSSLFYGQKIIISLQGELQSALFGRSNTRSPTGAESI